MLLQFGTLTQPRGVPASPMMPLPNSATTGFLRITMHQHNLVFTQAHRTSIRPHDVQVQTVTQQYEHTLQLRALLPRGASTAQRSSGTKHTAKGPRESSPSNIQRMRQLFALAKNKIEAGQSSHVELRTAVRTPGTVLFERIVATSSCVGIQGKMGRGEHTQKQERREGRTICEQLHCSPRSSTRATDCKFLGVVEATWMFAR